MATKKEIEEIKVPEGQEEATEGATLVEGGDGGAQAGKKMSTGKKLGIGGGIVVVLAALAYGVKKLLG